MVTFVFPDNLASAAAHVLSHKACGVNILLLPEALVGRTPLYSNPEMTLGYVMTGEIIQDRGLKAGQITRKQKQLTHFSVRQLSRPLPSLLQG